MNPEDRKQGFNYVLRSKSTIPGERCQKNKNEQFNSAIPANAVGKSAGIEASRFSLPQISKSRNFGYMRNTAHPNNYNNRLKGKNLGILRIADSEPPKLPLIKPFGSPSIRCQRCIDNDKLISAFQEYLRTVAVPMNENETIRKLSLRLVSNIDEKANNLQLEKSLDIVKNAIEFSKQQRELLEREILSLKTTNDDCQSKIRKLTEENKGLIEELEQCRTKIQDLESQLKFLYNKEDSNKAAEIRKKNFEFSFPNEANRSNSSVEQKSKKNAINKEQKKFKDPIIGIDKENYRQEISDRDEIIKILYDKLKDYEKAKSEALIELSKSKQAYADIAAAFDKAKSDVLIDPKKYQQAYTKIAEAFKFALDVCYNNNHELSEFCQAWYKELNDIQQRGFFST